MATRHRITGRLNSVPLKLASLVAIAFLMTSVAASLGWGQGWPATFLGWSSKPDGNSGFLRSSTSSVRCPATGLKNFSARRRQNGSAFKGKLQLDEKQGVAFAIGAASWARRRADRWQNTS